MPFFAQHIKSARLHLRKSDPVMRTIIKQVGPFTAKAQRDRFATLVSSIISQQISVAAASTVKGNLLKAVGDEGFTPESISRFDVDSLRELGVSRQKASYVLDLAEKVNCGVLDLKAIHKLDNKAAIEQLIVVKGIGRWTAQIFLMFSLARMDVMPVDDLGIKNAIKTRYELKELPNQQQMEKLAEKWTPYETIACWYLWQSLEV